MFCRGGTPQSQLGWDNLVICNFTFTSAWSGATPYLIKPNGTGSLSITSTTAWELSCQSHSMPSVVSQLWHQQIQSYRLTLMIWCAVLSPPTPLPTTHTLREGRMELEQTEVLKLLHLNMRKDSAAMQIWEWASYLASWLICDIA